MTKTETNNCFIIHCLELNNDKLGTVRPSHGTDLTLLRLENHALHAQPTD